MSSWQNAILQVLITAQGNKRRLSSVQAARQRERTLALRPGRYAPPRRLDRVVRLSIETIAGWPVYTCAPRGGPAIRQVLYLHGGAHIAEIKAFHWDQVGRVTSRVPAEVTVPIYPLAPFSTAEATVAGVAALATRLIERHGAGNVVLMGDSSGGGIALAVAEMLRDQGSEQPARLVLICPWLDVSMTDPRQAEIEPNDPLQSRPGLAEHGRLYAGDLDISDHRVSPLRGDLRGLAPITVFAADRDILYTDAINLAERARAAGTFIELHKGHGMFHGWPLFPTPEGRAAGDLIVRACRQ